MICLIKFGICSLDYPWKSLFTPKHSSTSHSQVKCDNTNERFLIFVAAQQSPKRTNPINCTTSQVKPSNLLPKKKTKPPTVCCFLRNFKIHRMQPKLMQISIASNGIGKSCDATDANNSRLRVIPNSLNRAWCIIPFEARYIIHRKNKTGSRALLHPSRSWWLADADVNLSGTRIGEIGDHVIGISLTAETVGRWCGQGLGQPQKAGHAVGSQTTKTTTATTTLKCQSTHLTVCCSSPTSGASSRRTADLHWIWMAGRRGQFSSASRWLLLWCWHCRRFDRHFPEPARHLRRSLLPAKFCIMHRFSRHKSKVVALRRSWPRWWSSSTSGRRFVCWRACWADCCACWDLATRRGRRAAATCTRPARGWNETRESR